MNKHTFTSLTKLLVILLFSDQIFAQESDSYLHLTPNKNLTDNKDLSDFSASYIGDSSNISIINFAGNFDRNINGNLNIEARQVVTQEFYNYQPDQYDFLVIFTKFPVDSGAAAAFNLSFENDVQGIGLPLFDNSLDMGSERLQATIDMTELSDWELNPSNREFKLTMGVLLHEMMHRWGVRAKFLDENNQISDLTLGRDGSHWNYFLNSNASVMYGSLWDDLGDNQFQTTAVRNSLSPLDLYLMGFREPASVPDFFLIDNGTPGNRYDFPPLIGTGATGNRVNISINDVIAAEGERIPSAQNAQHKFNFKFILLKSFEQALDADDIGRLVTLQREFQKQFFVNTAGIGEIVYNLPTQININGNPVGLSFDPVNRPVPDLIDAESFLINNQITPQGYWADKEATKVRDTVLAVEALQLFDQPEAFNLGASWINSYQAINNDELAWQLLSGTLTAEKKNELITQLIENINDDGGWGLSPDSESSIFDSALVLRSLLTNGYSVYTPSTHTKQYINSHINSDFGVGYTSGGVSSLTSSVMLLHTLSQLTSDITAEPSLIDYIVNLQKPGGGFGAGDVATVHETAVAIEALLNTNSQNHSQAINDAKAKLASMHSVDGSFEGSVYSTALALQVLFNDLRPNLSLNSIDLSNSQAVSGEQIAVYFDVSHIDNDVAVDISVTLYFDQQVVSSELLAQIAPNQTVSGYLVFDTDGIVGEQILTVMVDDGDLLSESNEADNELEVSLDIQAQSSAPELVIDWSTLNYQPKVFDALPFNFSSDFSVSNLSNSEIDDVKVSLIKLNDDSSQVELQSFTENFSANETRPFNFDAVVNNVNDELNLLLIIDPENIIAEVNEQNNQVALTLPKQPSIDLSIISAQISLPGQFILGQQSSTTFEFTNSGTESAPIFNVKVLYHDSAGQQELYSSLILAMDGGETLSRQFFWVPPQSGEFTLEFVLDQGNIVPEVNEANNGITLPITVVANGFTNLVMNDTDISINPDPGLTGQLLTINALVKNNSNVSSGLFDLNFYQQVPGSVSELITTVTANASIAPAGEANIITQLNDLDLSGDVTFIVEIDPVDAIVEFNENDNVGFKDFQILNKPDATVSSGGFTLTPSIPVLGSELNVEVVTANIGEQQLLNVELKIYTQSGDQLTEVASLTIPVIDGGQVHNSVFDFIFPNDPTITALVAEVDYGNLIDEISEVNNQATLLIGNQDRSFYVTESYFSPDGDGVKDQTQVVFNLNETDDYRIQIIDQFNLVVRGFTVFSNTDFGDVFWDGRNNQQKIVRDGEYAISISGTNTNYQNVVNVVLDTNRSTISEAIVDSDDFFVDLTCVLDDIYGFHLYSLDGRYIYTSNYKDKNDNDQIGLFSIKADGSEIKGVLPESFYANRHRGIGHLSILNNGMLLVEFRTTESVDELWMIDPVERNYEQLNTDGIPDFRVVEAADHSIILQVYSNPRSYYLISKNPAIAPSLLNLSLPSGEFVGAEFDYTQDLLVWHTYVNEKVFFATYEQVINNPSEISELGTGELSVSSDKTLFVLNAANQVLFFKKQNNQLVEVAAVPKSASIEAQYLQLLPNNDVLVLADANIYIYNSNGVEFLTFPHRFSYEHMQEKIIEYYGSLDLIRYLGEAPLNYYSLSDVQNLEMTFKDFNLNWASERELYLRFSMELTGFLDLSEFGMQDEQVFINPLNYDDHQQFKINYSSLDAIEVISLDTFVAGNSRFREKLSPYFLNGDSFYLKQQVAEPNRIETTFWDNYDPVSLRSYSPSSETDKVNKILIESNDSPVNSLCSGAGDKFIGIYQSSKNLTAFIQANNEQSGVKITGSAFDQNFAYYVLEYRKIDQPNSTWNQVKTSVDQVFTDLLAYWSPPVSGNYQLRLTVTDLAGNKQSDFTGVYVGNYSSSIKNVDAGPKFFSPNGDGILDSVNINYEVTQSTELEIIISNALGQAVKTITREYVGGGHLELITWDGTNQLGQIVADGEYNINIRGFVFAVYKDTILPNYLSPPTINFNRERDHITPVLTIYKPFVKSVGYDHNNKIVDQPDSVNFPENRIDFEYQLYDSNTDNWLSTYLPFPLGYDPFTAFNLSKPLYRHVMTDKAGNKFISATFSYPNRMFSAELVVKSVNQPPAIIPLSVDCSRGGCGINSQPVDMAVYGFGLDFSEGKRLAWVIQSYDNQTVDHLILETTVDGQLQSIEMKHFSAAENASDFFHPEDILPNDGLPANMMKLSNEGEPTYVYVLELESDDIITEFSTAVSYELKMIGTDDIEFDSVSFSTNNYVDFESKKLLLEEVTGYVGTDLTPEFLFNYLSHFNLEEPLLTEFEEATKDIWQDTISGLVKQTGKRYFLGYELRSDESGNILTENNTLDVTFLDQNLNDFDLLPMVNNQGIHDGKSYQAVLFSFDAESCEQIVSVEWKFLNDELQPDGVFKTGLGLNGLCFDGGVTQFYQANEMCNQSAAPNNQVSLLIDLKRNGFASDIASVELFRYVDDEELLIWADTNPIFSENGDLGFTLNFDIQDFSSGQLWIYFKISDVEGDVWYGIYPVFINKENVIPDVITPSIDNQTFCAQDSEIGTITVPLLVNTGTNLPYHLSVNLLHQGLPEELINNNPVQYGWLNSFETLARGYDSPEPLLQETLRFGLPSYSGPAQLMVETMNATGVSSCDIVPIEVDSKVDVFTQLEGLTQYLSPNNDAINDSLEYGTISANENIQIELFLQYLPNDNSGAVDIGVLETLDMTDGQDTTLEWNGYFNSLIVAEGQYTIQVRITDDCAISKYWFVSFIIDTTFPESAFNHPIDNQSVAPIIDVIADIEEANLDEDSVELAYQYNGIWTPLAIENLSPVAATDYYSVLTGWNLSQLPSGQYPLRLTAVDLAGNETSISIQVNRNEPQNLFWNFGIDQRYISPNNDAVQDAVNINVGLNLNALVTLHIEDQNQSIVRNLQVETQMNQGSHGILWDGKDDLDQLVVDGDYQIIVTATEVGNIGNVESLGVNISIDNTNPAIQMSPMDSIIKGEGLLTLNLVEAHFAATQIWLQKTEPVEPEELILDANAQGLYDLIDLSELDETTYQIRVLASDLAGNSQSLTYGFEIDNTAPLIAIETPSDLSYQGDQTGLISVTGEIIDKNFSDYQVFISPDAEPRVWDLMFTGNVLDENKFMNDWPIAVTDGVYLIRALAVDQAGREAEDIIKISIDTQAPNVSLSNPIIDSTQGTSIDIIGTVNDANLSSFIISYKRADEGESQWMLIHSGLESYTDSQLYSWQHQLASAVYDLRLKGEDFAGHESEAIVSFNIDSDAPLSPLYLTAELSTNDVALAWQTSSSGDVAGYWIYRNNTVLNSELLNGGSYLDVGISEGEFIYWIVAVDHAGNISLPSNSANIVVDNTGPQVFLQSPVNGELVSGVVDVYGSTESPDDFLSYHLYYREVSETPPGWLIAQSSLPSSGGLMASIDSALLINDAQYLIRLEAQDFSQNLSSVEHLIRVDNLAPSAPLNLTFSVSAGNDVTLNWNANPEADLAGYLVFRNDDIISGSGSIGSSIILSTSYDDTDVVDGIHTYHVVAVDLSQNISLISNSVEVLIDQNVPHAFFVSPAANDEFEQPIGLIAESDDIDIENVSFEYSTDGSVWSEFYMDAAAPYEAVFDANEFGLSYGVIQFKVTATDQGAQVDPTPDQINLIYTDLTPPETVQSLQAVVLSDEIQLSWDANVETDFQGYQVSRKQIAPIQEQQFTDLNVTLLLTNGFVDTGLIAGVYRYRVVAIDDYDNLSDWSETSDVTVWSIEITQPFSPVLLPADVTLEGYSLVQGEVNTTLVDINGTQILPLEVTQVNGIIEVISTDLNQGESTFTLYVEDSNGNQSITIDRSIEVSPASNVPVNPQSAVNDLDLSLSWQAPDVSTIGYLIYLDGQPVLQRERLINGITFNSSSDGFNGDKVLDGDENTYWRPSTNDIRNGQPTYIELHFNQAIWISSSEIKWYSSSTIYRPSTYQLQYLSPVGWVTQNDFTGNESASVSHTGLVPYLATAARIWMPLEANSPDSIRLSEFNIQQQPFTNQLSFNETLSDGQYEWQVSAINQYGFESERTDAESLSVGDILPPEAVVLNGLVQNSNSVQLNWSASTSVDVAYYRLFRNNELIVSTSDAATLSHLDESLANGDYNYFVAAVDAAGNSSAASNLISLNISQQVLDPPTGLLIEPIETGGALSLSWNPHTSPDWAAFKIYRSLILNTGFLEVGSLADNSWLDEELNDGITYYYYVTALDVSGNESQPSLIVSGMPNDLIAPIKPAITKPTVFNEPIAVNTLTTDISGLASAAVKVDLYRSGNLIDTVFASDNYTQTESNSNQYFSSARLNETNTYIVSYEFMSGLLTITDPEAATFTPIENSALRNYFWNHAGSKVFAISGYGDQSELKSFGLDGIEIATHLTGYNISLASVSADEGQLLYWGDGLNPDNSTIENGLWLYTFVGSVHQKIELNQPVALYYDAIQWMSDGRVAFINFPNGTSNQGLVWIYDIQNNVAQMLVDSTSDSATLRSSSDGMYLYFDVNESGFQAVKRYRISDAEERILSKSGINVSLPLVGDDNDLVFVNVDCCNKELINIETAEVELRVDDSGYNSRGAWLNDGRILLMKNGGLLTLSPPGMFKFNDIELNPGLNEFHVTSKKSNGLSSPASESIEVSLNSSILPDLAIEANYLQIIPAQVMVGGVVSGSLLVKNASQVEIEGADVLIELIDPDLNSQIIFPSPFEFDLSAGELFAQNFSINEINKVGEYTLRVTADYNQQLLETNENNNSIIKVFQAVDDLIPDISLNLSSPTVSPGSDLLGQIRVYNPGTDFNGSVVLRITDVDGFPVGYEESFNLPLLITGSDWDKVFSWDSSDVFAGEYLVEVTLYDQNQQLIEQQIESFAVSEIAEFSLSLSTAATQVTINQAVNLLAEINYQSGNVSQSGTLTWEIFDDTQQLIWSNTTPTSVMSPGFSGTFEKTWTAGTIGAYQASVTLDTSLDSETATVPFEVIPITAELSLSGLIDDLPAGVILGQTWNANYEVQNFGQIDVSNVPVSLALWNSELSQLIDQQNTAVTLIAGDSSTLMTVWDSNNLSIGNYVLVLSADLSAQGESATYLLDTQAIQTVDISAPQINVINPTEQGYYSSSFELRAEVNDLHSAVESVVINLDGNAEVSLQGQQLNNLYQYWLTDLSEGVHQVNVIATDTNGNTSNQLLNFNIDSTSPIITVTGINDGGLYNQTVQANIAISDANLDTSQIILDGVPYTSGDLIAAEGSHILLVSATDLAGNTATNRLFFNIDLTPPTVIITYPANGIETNQVNTIVSGSTEVNAALSLTNGAYTDVLSTDFAGNFSFADVPLTSGNNVISITATDLAGNTGQASEVNVIFVDDISVSGLLSAEATHPLGQNLTFDWQITNLNDSVVSQLPVELNLYRVSDNQLVATDAQIIALGAIDSFEDSTVLDTNGLSPGDHRIELRVEIDQLWQILDDHLIVLQDIAGPVINVVEPVANQVTQATVDLLVQATDLHSNVEELSYQLIGNASWLPMTWSGTEYVAQLELNHGDHQIIFRAVDTFANETITAVIPLTVDTIAPAIDVLTPVDGLITNQAVTIDFVVTDDHTFNVDAQLNQISISNGDSVTDEGEYELVISATDEVNNQSAVTRNFIIDTTAPVVIVTSPAMDIQNTTGFLAVIGAAEDRNVITVLVNGVESTLKTDASGGFISANNALQLGMNLIVVTATDQAGNVSQPVSRNIEYIQVGSITGRIWQDDDQDAIIDVGELGFNQVSLRLTDSDQISQDILTDTEGNYQFVGLLPGQYTIEVVEAELLEDWINTTTNTPMVVDITVNEAVEINFGFYQAKPVIEAGLVANSLKGRLLLLTDPPTAQVDINQCIGVSDYQMQRFIETEFTSSDSIWAKLYDDQGALLQTETATYADFVNNGYQSIDQQAETNEFNLVLHPVENRHLTASVISSSVANPAILSAQYRLVLGLQTLDGSTQWSSELVVDACELFATIGNQSGDLQLADVGLNPPLASDDPNGSNQAPHLSSQYVWLENMLKDAGWSYAITTEASEFEAALSSGQYVAYWLMAENVSLPTLTQNNIMDAVDEGAGLVVSSGHDNLSTQFYSSLGVNVSGTHLSATELELLDSVISESSVLDISHDEQVMKVSLTDAMSAGTFNGAGVNLPDNQAVTWLDGEEGSSVFSSMDWLLQATDAYGFNYYTSLIKSVLEYIHPLGLSNELGYARAVQFNMQNLGRPVDGFVQVLLPPMLNLVYSEIPVTANQDGFMFEYNLLENELLELEFWLKVDTTPATLTFEIHLDDDISVFNTLDLTLVAGQRPDISASISNCQTGVKPDQILQYRYDVSNTGNQNINGALAFTQLDVGLQNTVWTCSGSLGGVCGQISGTGDLSGQRIDLPVGASVNFLFDTQVMVQSPSSVISSGYVLMPEGIPDVNPGDNSSVDFDSVYQFVFKNGFECAPAGEIENKNQSVILTKEGL